MRVINSMPNGPCGHPLLVAGNIERTPRIAKV